MKKIYASFILFFAGLAITNAQSLTQANNAPAIGDSYRTTDVSTVGVTPGAAGASVTWDMSAISIGTNIIVYTVVAVPSSSAASYPSANLAVQTGTTSNYNFYSPSSTALKYWGGSITVSTVNVVMTYTGTAAAVVTTYSMGYNATNSNPVSGTIYVPAFSQSGTFSGTASVIADGFGTLALPSRTFTSVLRKKTTQDLTFTVSVGSGSIKQETYEFFGSGLAKSSLFTVSTATVTLPFVGTSSQTMVTVNSDYMTVGVKENTKEVASLNVFPNPCKNEFTVSFLNENGKSSSYEIINSIGQVVKKAELNSGTGIVNYNIDVTELQSGVYFVKVNLGDQSSVKKLTKQ